jgi:hypothetical protein
MPMTLCSRLVPRLLLLALFASALGSCTLDDSGRGTASSSCGNDYLDPHEECDGIYLRDALCVHLGFSDGEIRCTEQCTLDISACFTCGNGVREGLEDCDGDDLAGGSCATVVGSSSGDLRCTSQCRWDPSRCATCGNGWREGDEVCDGFAPSSATCQSVAARESGEVRCSKACLLDTSRCHTCGDGLVEGPEACDGSDLGGASCEQLGYPSGTLACRDDCSIDASRCVAPTADWYDDAWLYRRPLTVAKALVDADLLGFPLLVSFAHPELAERATSLQDFLFTMDDGTTVLPHEIVSYDPVLGSLKAWVRVPALRAIFDTRIFVYYGNPSPPPMPNPALVWTEGFEAVWHLDEPAIDESSGVHHADSATGQHPGVQSGNHDVPGKIGRAQRFDGQNDRVIIEGADTISLGDADCTVSAWVRTNSALPTSLMAKNRESAHEPGDKLLGLTAGKLAIDHGWVGYLSSTKLVNDAEWRQVVWAQRKDAVGESETWTLYVDGVADGTIDLSTQPDVAGHTLFLGGATVASYFPYPWEGDIDEVTVSRVARSAVWVAVSYANQNAPEAFATLGAEQTILVGE